MIRKLISILVIMLVISLGWLLFRPTNASRQTRPPNHKRVTFRCFNNRSVHADFYRESVNLKLSDGRLLTLQHVRSGSGARYADADGRIVFWNKGTTAFLTENDSATYHDCIQNGKDDLVHLRTFRDSLADITFRYPGILHLQQKMVNDTGSWSYTNSSRGMLVARLTTDKSYQPGTNLSAAGFSIGWSDRPGALKRCFTTAGGRVLQHDSLSINKIKYQRIQYGDAGAGNFYEVIQYRAIRNKRCYSIEQMVHSTNIHNYPPERGIVRYDSARIWDALNSIMATVRFNK